MFSRLFKKAHPQDQREQYRRTIGKSAALGVKMICSNGAPVSGSLQNLSAGGAAVEFAEPLPEGELAIGDLRELVFSSLTKQSVRAFAQVRSAPRPDEDVARYGFQFVDGEALFEAIDDSFYKYFNRRQFRRAKPALDENLRADLSFGTITETVKVYDVSMGGVSFYVTDDIAEMLSVDMPVEIKLPVPKTEYTLTHYGIVRHVSQDPRGNRVGLSIEVVSDQESKRAVRKAQGALEDYIQARIDEMDRYNSAYN